jgi:hypothetical protein
MIWREIMILRLAAACHKMLGYCILLLWQLLLWMLPWWFFMILLLLLLLLQLQV